MRHIPYTSNYLSLATALANIRRTRCVHLAGYMERADGWMRRDGDDDDDDDDGDEIGKQRLQQSSQVKSSQ